jgi:hypothetical protein
MRAKGYVRNDHTAQESIVGSTLSGNAFTIT